MATTASLRNEAWRCPDDDFGYTPSKEGSSTTSWIRATLSAVHGWYRSCTSPASDPDPRLLDVLLSNRNSWSVTQDLTAAESLRRQLERDSAMKRLRSRTKSCWTRWLKRGSTPDAKSRRTSWRQAKPCTTIDVETLQLPRKCDLAMMGQADSQSREETITAGPSAYWVW